MSTVDEEDQWPGSVGRKFWVAVCVVLLGAGVTFRVVEKMGWSIACLVALLVFGLMISVADDGGLGD